MSIKVFVIIGTRPEAIKMAPVVKALQADSAFDCRLCLTGQHRDLLHPMLDVFGLRPDFDLNVMKEAQHPAAVMASILTLLTDLVRQEKPDWLLVQGDTSTVAAASLVAYLEWIKLGHVEAGLRTFDKHQPFPEEMFRRVADLAADLHFAPTERARSNLLREGHPEATVHVTGNTVVDALRMVAEWQGDAPPPHHSLPKGLDGQRIVLVTVHRRENLGQPLLRICRALHGIAGRVNGTAHLVCTVHPNPNVSTVLRRELAGPPNISLIPPLDYLEFVAMMRRSHLILTDSGGVQEEAPTFGKPVLVLRNVTERPEAVEAGTSCLVGTDDTVIVREACRLLEDSAAYDRMSHVANPFGDGHAAERIAALLKEEQPAAPETEETQCASS